MTFPIGFAVPAWMGGTVCAPAGTDMKLLATSPATSTAMIRGRIVPSEVAAYVNTDLSSIIIPAYQQPLFGLINCGIGRGFILSAWESVPRLWVGPSARSENRI